MTERLENLRRNLEGAGCDAFVSLAPPMNQYLSGFLGTTSAVIVTETDSWFLCDFRYAEQAAAQVDGGFEVEEVDGDLLVRVGERLAEAGVKQAAFEPADMTVGQREAVEKAFDGALHSRPAVACALRRTKSADEIEKIAAAQQLTEGVLEDLIERVGPGTTERELAATVEFEFKRRGATGAAFDTIALFGARSSLPHGAPEDRPLGNGDIVLVDLGCRLDGYCSDMTRTFVCGDSAEPWFEEVYDLTLTAQQIAIEAIRPGITCRELDADARNLIHEAGYGDQFGHGLGHGVGIEVHEAPRVNKDSETVLTPGMVVTVEPGIYLPGKGGVRIEDLVVVTEDGCRNLTSAPKEFRVLSV